MPDITLDGNVFQIHHSDTPGYEKRWVRRETLDQAVRPTTRLAITSRDDLATMHQTNWEGGSTWWKPLIDVETASAYFDATNMDAFSKPGHIRPANKRTAVGLATFNAGPMFAAGADIYTILATKTEDATYWDVGKWTPASNNWVRETGYSSGVASANYIHGVVYNPGDAYAYIMGAAFLARFDLVSAQNSNWIAVTAKAGDGIMMTADGKVWVYDDGVFKELDTSGPTFTTRKDDGFGPDILASIATPGTPLAYPSDLHLAVAGAGGVFYVKNTYANGMPKAYLARVDRDQSGSYIRYALTDLPDGVLVLNVTQHLGSVIMATTQDWQLALQNDATATETPRVDFYHYTEGGGLGVIGSPDREAPTEYPVSFLGALGPHLMIGSESRLWVYDARNGGIHPWLDLVDASAGVFKGATTVVDSSKNQQLLIKEDASASVMNMITDDPVTVASFGDDLTTYLFDSNYFDFNRPFEDKTLLTFDVMTELITANQKFSIYISVDDGAWTLIGSHTGAISFSTTDISASSYTGKRFRYRVVYETKTAALFGLMGIEFRAGAGEMVPIWSLVLSGRDIRNLDNQPLDLEGVRDNLETTAAKEASVALIDNYKSHRIEDTETVRVLIGEIAIVKDTAGEALFQLELVGY